MTRSYYHNPVSKQCGSKSEKFYKRHRAHKERSRVRNNLSHGDYDIGYELYPWNEWSTGRDGKQWDSDWFDGEILPKTRWEYIVYHSGIRKYDKRLSRKRRSK